MDDVLKLLELLSAGVEGVFEGAILVLQVALDGLDAGFEGDHDAVDVLDGVEERFAEGGEHGGDDFEGGDAAVDEAVLVLPIGAACC